MLWRVLFAPGHDACRVTETKGGSVIDGAAVFVENAVVSNLRYRVECGADWVSHHAEVAGWIGTREVDVVIKQVSGVWTVRGVSVAANVAGLSDVDLGFTPATNTNAIRRLRLDVGAKAETTALWLDVDNWAVKPLRQIYRRLDRDYYEYTSPDHDYRAVLTVNDIGLVVDYPKLWAAQGAEA